jgi:hypothetical protein
MLRDCPWLDPVPRSASNVDELSDIADENEIVDIVVLVFNYDLASNFVIFFDFLLNVLNIHLGTAIYKEIYPLWRNVSVKFSNML